MWKSVFPSTTLEVSDSSRLVGITTTVPIEVMYAAGLLPVDLNNVFITAPDPHELVDAAERAGFPRTCCCWTKGLYGAVHALGIGVVTGVIRGDCSNTHALLEILRYEGIRCIPFDYPYEPDPQEMQPALERFASLLETDLKAAEAWRERLRPARELAAEIDRLSWQECRISGKEHHLWIVSASDFCTDPQRYTAEAERFVAAASAREAIPARVRLGYVGVPPIVDGLYEYIESNGGLVVYNETQRQFAMLSPAESLAEQYSRYTYPYGISVRLEDIRAECRRRALDGVIHYVQSFCFRRIEDRMLREGVGVPVLTVECDRPGPPSGQLKTRLEAFVQMLIARKEGRRLF